MTGRRCLDKERHKCDVGSRCVPVLSVIVPAYQAEKSIGRLLNSLLLWNGEDMELIVVDDGSTDGTASIVSSIASRDSRVRLIKQANGGRSSARNAGVHCARGEWIMFADSDDYLFDSWQNAIRDAQKADCDLSIFSMVRSDGLDAFGSLPEPHGDLAANRLPAKAVFAALADGSFRTAIDSAGSFEWNACWSRLYRRDIVEKVAAANGGDAFPVGLKFSEDRLFNLAYLKAMGGSRVMFDYRPVYYWDLGLSSTVAKVSPDDPKSLIAFAEAADVMGGSLGFSGETPEIVAMEVASQFRRSASLPGSQLRAAARSWHHVIESGVLEKCAGLLGEFIGGKAWAYKPALTLLSAGKPLGALALAHGVTAAGVFLKSFRRG